jgi:cytochrome c-type biogenesis protein CcsB
VSQAISKINSILFSNKSSIIILCIFFVVNVTATFIENSYDTFTAQSLIYRSKWFEVILVLLVLNFIGNIKKYNLLLKEKAASLLLHLAFIMLILGAGVTRYFGFEADMHIREGNSSNIIYSSDPYFQVKNINNSSSFISENPIYFSQIGKKPKNLVVDIENNTIDVEFIEIIKSAKEILLPKIGNEDIIELSYAHKNGATESIYLRKGTYKKIGNIVLSYLSDYDSNSVHIIENNNELFIQSVYSVRMNKKMEYESQLIEKDSICEFKIDYVYHINGEMFLLVQHHKNARIKWINGDPDKSSIDVMITNIKAKNISKEVELFFDNEKYIQKPSRINMDGIEYELTYGPKPIEIPFSLQLNDFILHKFPGTDIPSFHKSEVTLIDERYNLIEKHSIQKNNVLKYDGYKFFQTLYDKDEKGTILSVNHDFHGTLISYIGYFLLTLAFAVLLIQEHSRFNILGKKIKEIRILKKKLLLVLITLISVTSVANNGKVNEEHAKIFGKLIVQTYDGRFAPINSVAHNVIHKISKKDKIEVPGYKKINTTEIFMDMFHDPNLWKQQNIIYVREKSIRNIIGIKDKYAAFNDFFNEQNQYIFENQLHTTFNKKPTDQSRFDKELIKLTERINICMMTFNGSFLKIFPDQNSTNNNWIRWDNKKANMPIKENMNLLNEYFKDSEISYKKIMLVYLNSVIEAKKTNNYSKSNQILSLIGNYQKQTDSNNLLPTEFQVKAEIFYNEARIFNVLKYIYVLLSFLFLIVAIIENFTILNTKVIPLVHTIIIFIISTAFLYHTIGLALRWYLTSHAPWSNGYETLLLIAWGAILAGISYLRNSKFSLAATTLLAFFILLTAGHSYYDPQLTNLQPVLDSYWLIFHVAIITIGYSFLGIGFIIGIFNITLSIFKSTRNKLKFDLTIQELTYINERLLIVGLFLTTVGTFLGAVWANESWGRYWGWDPKETWSLIIILTYTILLHLRLIPSLKSILVFNVGSIISFVSVLMTFIGVNYYFRNGLHSYATDDPPIFPIWAWISILILIILIIAAIFKERYFLKKTPNLFNVKNP